MPCTGVSRVPRPVVPRNFAPGGLTVADGIDRASTARAIFPQTLLFREA